MSKLICETCVIANCECVPYGAECDSCIRAYQQGYSEGAKDLGKLYSEIRAEAINECIKIMKYSWYNGQQPLDVLVRRMEQLKEKR